MFTSRAVNRRRPAFTLVEMLVSMGAGSVVMLAVCSTFFFFAKATISLSNYSDLDNASRNALDTITRDIRQMIQLDSYSSNATTIRLDLLATNGTLALVYDRPSKRLTRVYGTQSTVLLQDCDSLNFALFQRNPMGGTYDQYPAATNNLATTCKLIQMSWICSRKILGNTMNTESVQTAKIVIRKQ
ncbi:MAG: prepilin-type N-terminal cleavage/methylation domain-containing protein [Opitutaceae bacterium]|nr:prepilin-type N-terminal cleavage/methylation domain-containing protein [Verrucomicrobiales bacterium]